MNFVRPQFAAFAVLLGITVPLAAQQIDPDVAAARDRIKPAAIAAHIRFLADDLLEGRETGTRGFQLAANYVAAQFAAAGLQAAGDRGSYFQEINFRSAQLVDAGSSLAINDGPVTEPLALRKDFILMPDFTRAESSFSAPVVFAGFGIVAPELGRDDYGRLDVKGKIVVLLTGAPAAFPNNQRAYYSNTLVKEQAAAAHGAIGILLMKTNADEARYPFEKMLSQSGMVALRYLNAEGKPAETVTALQGVALLSHAAATRFFARAIESLDVVLKDADRGNTHSFPLNLSATIRTATKSSQLKSANIVALLPGSDPATRDEYVVISAHLDHLGMHDTGNADHIYNGALDNASGIASLIEIARAFASMPKAPHRSILFTAFTGEEKGELGSLYFAEHPPSGAGSIVADVNMDMFMMLYPVKDLVAFGSEHSTLGPLAAEAAAASSFELSPDPNPEELRFIRSDQYSFVRRGIPSIILKSGSRSTDPSIDGDKASREWLRTVYHSPQDDLSQPMDFPSGARYAQTNFLLGAEIANAPTRPQWNVGDFFGDKFGRGTAVERPTQ